MDGKELQPMNTSMESPTSTEILKDITQISDGGTTANKKNIFVNKGFQAWEKGRQEWLSKANANPAGKNNRGAIDLNVDEVIDCIVSNRWRSALKGGKDKAMFPRPVPLPQMIDILTDLWEAEGLDV